MAIIYYSYVCTYSMLKFLNFNLKTFHLPYFLYQKPPWYRSRPRLEAAVFCDVGEIQAALNYKPPSIISRDFWKMRRQKIWCQTFSAYTSFIIVAFEMDSPSLKRKFEEFNKNY